MKEIQKIQIELDKLNSSIHTDVLSYLFRNKRNDRSTDCLKTPIVWESVCVCVGGGVPLEPNVQANKNSNNAFTVVGR